MCSTVLVNILAATTEEEGVLSSQYTVGALMRSANFQYISL